jgi:hypothetical protein
MLLFVRAPLAVAANAALFSLWPLSGEFQTAERMMSCALHGILSISVSSFLLFFDFGGKLGRGVTVDGLLSLVVDGPVGDLVKLVAPFALVEPKRRPDLAARVRAAAIGVPVALGKAAVGLWVSTSLLRTEAAVSQFSPRAFTLCAVLGVHFMTGMWFMDALQAVVPLLTGGRAKVLVLSDFLPSASSCKDFWGNRYNQFMSRFLRERVFVPAETTLGLSRPAAKALTFAASGALHAYVAFFTFSQDPATAATGFAFFAVHGLLAHLEDSIEARWGVPKRALFWAVLALSAPLYVGHFALALEKYKTSEGFQADSVLFGLITRDHFKDLLIKV